MITKSMWFDLIDIYETNYVHPGTQPFDKRLFCFGILSLSMLLGLTFHNQTYYSQYYVLPRSLKCKIVVANNNSLPC
jgi:hypothetical protein